MSDKKLFYESEKLNPDYYIPEPEEFILGFEFEIRTFIDYPIFNPSTGEVTNNPEIIFTKIKVDHLFQLTTICNLKTVGDKKEITIGDSIRAKKFSGKDLKDEGYATIKIPYLYSKGNIRIVDLKNNIFKISNQYYEDDLYRGKIKSISHFKEIMKWIE